jgi:hypothetical protein
MQPEAPAQVWLFDRFVAGAEIGSCSQAVDSALLRQLRRVYGGAGSAPSRGESATLAMVIMMRAYMSLVAPRPPGNIHARQRLRLEALPALGETLQTTVRCLGKEIRRERRFVDFEAAGTGAGGRPVFNGILTLVWAA